MAVAPCQGGGNGVFMSYILRVFMKILTLKSLTLNVRMKEGHLHQHFIQVKLEFELSKQANFEVDNSVGLLVLT